MRSLGNENEFSVIWNAELITITKFSHFDSLSNRSSSELGNGPFPPSLPVVPAYRSRGGFPYGTDGDARRLA